MAEITGLTDAEAQAAAEAEAARKAEDGGDGEDGEGSYKQANQFKWVKGQGFAFIIV